MRNTLRTFIFPVLLLFGTVLAAQTSEELSVRRFGFYVASNNGGSERVRLLYADNDVMSLSRTMTELGGVSPMDEVSLFEPDARELDDAVDLLRQAVSGAEGARRTEVFFYYSGHSDERGLMLGDDLYGYGRLRDSLDTIGADVVVAVLDSCASGAFTREKGGIRRAPFLIDDSSRMEGHAFLTSSSADEVSQESDAIGGSFFTYYLVSGLRGAADTTRDGRVTLNEIYQHTYAETLARTEDTIGGPQHPNYDIRLTGAGDLVLTDLSQPTASLILGENLNGRVSVRDNTGILVAEVNKRQDEPLTMALPPGEYDLSLQVDKNRYTGTVLLQRGSTESISSDSFSRIRPEHTQFRGAEQAPRETVGFSFGVTPGLSYPKVQDSIVKFQIGAPVASAWAIEGVQLGLILADTEGGTDGWQAGLIGSTSRGPLSGVQSSGIYSTAGGTVSGGQISGIFNTTSGKVNGFQLAGIYNNASGTFSGMQFAGILNRSSGLFRGAQISVFYNQAAEIDGVQMGLVNVSEKSHGVLIGLVNYSDDMRAFPLGLINISRSGIRDLDMRWEQGDRKYISIKTGNRYYYTRFILGFSKWNMAKYPETLVLGFGAGLRFTLRPFYFELDLDWRTALEDYQDYSSAQESWENFLAVPTLSLTAGLGRKIGIYGGVGFSLKTPWVSRESVLFDSGYSMNLSSDGRWAGVFKFYGGLHL